jgi:triosephosphate isomerase
VRRALVAGNWKMHGAREASRQLLAALRVQLPAGNAECIVCPPFPCLDLAASLLAGSRIGLGAQDLSEHAEGAFTGEVSGAMLREAGCRYVIAGHSERREYHGEGNALVAAKAEAALGAGLVPIVCVGETAAQRERGETFAVIGAQFDAVAARLGAQRMQDVVVAYEPVWAIGTGLTATPAQAQEVHAWLRARLAAVSAQAARDVRLLYGGSVKAGNARELFAMPDIDGGLVGGASLVAAEFAAICSAAEGS